MDKKLIYKKWWIWLIAFLIIGFIASGQNKSSSQNKYINKYEWNLKDTKTGQITFDDGATEEYKYVVLGVENKEKDLEAGEYIIKTNDNSKSSFIIYLTNRYYENDADIPETFYSGMVQGFDKSELSIKVEKGQYLYLCQNYNGQGKVLVNKK